MGRTMRVRRDDDVIVIGGKDRGKRGRVIRTDPKRGFVYIEGLNMVKRHQRPRSVKEDNKPTRVRVERGDGKRKRVASRTGRDLD